MLSTGSTGSRSRPPSTDPMLPLLPCRCAVVAGLAIIVGYYCVATALAQRLLGITSLPAHLDLQPWGRRSQPHYPLAMAIWPFFGTRISWRAIHVVSNSFAWCYGVVEWNREYSYVKSRNGLWR